MRSVDMMREWASSGKLYSDTERFVLHFADEIEAEIAEQYMALPVDADGVPIRLGDIMERVDGGPSQQACCICPAGFNDAPIWCARDFRHVKPRTIEDVLEEFYHAVLNHDMDNTRLEQYAEEIRELLGGDAE